jgi:hypothetical protein
VPSIDDDGAAQTHEPTRAFLVSHRLTAPSSAELGTVERALHVACARMHAAGVPARLLATGYQPAQQRWLGLVLADDPAAVRRAAETAQLTTSHVVEV